MKQTKKILGLAVLVLSAGALVACGGGTEEPAESASTAHKHKYVEDKTQSVAATCTAKGKKVTVCECGDKKETETALAAHQYEEKAAEGQAATCTADGKKVSYCKVCNNKKEEVIQALGHDFVKAESQEGAVAPTCTTAGTEKQKCSRCDATQDAEVKALGHSFVDDEDQSRAETPACTFSGTVTQHCEHDGCTETRSSKVTATGHTFVAQGEPVAAVEDATGVTVGETTYKGYTTVGYTKELCSVDNVTRVSWDAKQVTTRCKAPSTERVVTSGHTADEDAVWEDKSEPHITENDNGVQFWGRAIGNAQILDDTGSSSQNDHVHEPSEAVEGSFMEYKINLAEALTSVRLTANLIPANYLSRNDIWRAAGAANDWTPGYQKGVDDEMHIVNDWRYVMFIDGNQIALDRTVDTKLIHSNSADWYTVPMRTMDLAAGEHTIKISMAGGYRHTFVNWGFETGIQHEHTVTVGEKAASSALREISCKCEKLVGYELKAAEATTGQLAPVGTDKNTRLGKNNIFEDVWNISGISTGMYEVYLNAQCSSGNKDSGKWKGDGTSISNNGGTEELAREYKYKIAIGEAPAAAAEGEEAPADTRTWVGLGGEYSYASTGIGETAAAWTTQALATIPVNSGSTALTIKNMDNGYSIWIYGVRLVKVSDFVY